MNYRTNSQFQVPGLGPVRNPYGEFPDYGPSLVRKPLSGLSGLSGPKAEYPFHCTENTWGEINRESVPYGARSDPCSLDHLAK